MNSIPTHVSIIMDGNGRWAKERGQERLFGHSEGLESVRVCIEHSIKRGIKYLSLFAFSEENWSRPTDEVNGLMELMVKAIVNEVPIFQKNGIKLKVIGDLDKLPQNIKDGAIESMSLTQDNTNLELIVFISYSGKWDIVQATNKFIENNFLKGKEGLVVNVNEIEKYLSTYPIPDPDLLIRTSGEIRISNYMLWQTAYTEFYFTETLWPDFRTNELDAALEAYSQRSRRFGKI